jgi:cytoskeletal protein CcmA (bactofilin family)
VAETQTVNYHWTMPDPGGSANTWGATLNKTTQAIDAVVWAITASDVTFAGSITVDGGLNVAGSGSFGGGLTCNGFNNTNGFTVSQASGSGDATFAMTNSAGTVMGLLYWDPQNQIILVNQTGGGYLIINPDGSVATSGAFHTQALTAANATFTGVTVNGALSVSGATATGALTASGNISTTGQLISGNTVQAIGYQCRQGITGGFGSNVFNAFYNSGSGHTQWYIDGAYQGDLAYQAPSDYRIKQNVTPLPSMWDRVKALRPIRYTHKEYAPLRAPKDNGKEHWGFIAHELQDALTDDAASGVKDQVDSLQSPNLMTVVATLTKALQEAMARVEALEARR